MEKIILGLAGLSSIILTPTPQISSPIQNQITVPKILAEHSMYLINRENNSYTNEVFSDNILLALHYFKNDAGNYKYYVNKQGPNNIDWEKIRKPFAFSINLAPGEIFAFHENIRKEYLDSPIITGKTKFNFEDGYKSIAGLSGNGVCYLASLINWTAQDANLLSSQQMLEIDSKVNHDFAVIPNIPRKYGTSIYYAPSGGNSQNQNLYIRNISQSQVTFNFSIEDNKVNLKISSY